MTTETARETYLRLTDYDLDDLVAIIGWAFRDQTDMGYMADNDEDAQIARDNLATIERMRKHVTGDYTR